MNRARRGGAAVCRSERRRFFNTGGDTCTVHELAEPVPRLAPGARIEVARRPAGQGLDGPGRSEP